MFTPLLAALMKVHLRYGSQSIIYIIQLDEYVDNWVIFRDRGDRDVYTSAYSYPLLGFNSNPILGDGYVIFAQIDGWPSHHRPPMLMNWSTIKIQWHQNAKAISQIDCDLNPDEPLEIHRSMIAAHTAVSTW